MLLVPANRVRWRHSVLGHRRTDNRSTAATSLGAVLARAVWDRRRKTSDGRANRSYRCDHEEGFRSPPTNCRYVQKKTT